MTGMMPVFEKKDKSSQFGIKKSVGRLEFHENEFGTISRYSSVQSFGLISVLRPFNTF